jgi:non-ribosomal peptide synthetase component F
VAVTGRFDFSDSSTVGQRVQLETGEGEGYDSVVMLWDVGKTTKPPAVLARLRLLVKFSETRLGLSLEWNPGQLLMTPQQGSLVAGTFARILNGIVTAGPETRLGKIDCLSEENAARIREWNGRVEVQPVERCVHDVIDEQVVQHPDKEAVCAWDGTFTYRELDEVATRLAGKLVQTGVIGKGVMVPLCFDKSVCVLPSAVAYDRELNIGTEMDSGSHDRSAQSWCRIRATRPRTSR